MGEISIIAKDGAAIPAAIYNAEGKAVKGVVIVSYGFGEHTGKYLELAGRFGQAGYACILFDQRGHGTPPDNRKKWFGIIKSYQNFLDDIASVTDAARSLLPGVPIILYGHSMGGNIVVNHLLRNSSGYTCAVLESPWLGLNNGPPPAVVSLVRFISRFAPDITITNKLTVSDLSSDPVSADGYTADRLYHNRISFRMFAGIADGCKYALSNASQLTIPVFLAYAANERIVSNKAIFQFAADAGDIVSVREYASCHAIHNDVKQEDYFRDMIAFLDANCLAL